MNRDSAFSQDSDELPLHVLIRALRRGLPIIVAVTMIVTISALSFSLKAQKQYTATAKLLFRDPGFDQRLFGSSILAPSQDPDREAATNLGLVSLDTVTRRTASALRDRGLTASEIASKVEIASEGRSDVVSVMATDRDPALAARLANTLAQQYIAFRRAADRSKITDAITLVQHQLDALNPDQRSGPDGRSVKERIEQLQILASLQTGNAELVQPAHAPRDPSSPRPVRNSVLGFIVGLLFGGAAALLRDRLDRRLRGVASAEAAFEHRPVLGTILESRGLRRLASQGLHLSGAEAEAFRALRTNLRYFAIDQKVQSLLITSSAPGDGKSTVARYLAATAAASGVPTVLVEADLRRPSLNAALPALLGRGLTDVLAGVASVTDVVQHVPVSLSSRPGDTPLANQHTLDVITSGPIPPNPTDLLESERMERLLSELERRYDLVIVDSSPLIVVPDAIPLARRVSGVLVVIRDGKSTTTSAHRLRKQFRNLDITPLGLIVNGTSPSEGAGYYGYYGYASPADAVPGTNGSGTATRSASSPPARSVSD